MLWCNGYSWGTEFQAQILVRSAFLFVSFFFEEIVKKIKNRTVLTTLYRTFPYTYSPLVFPIYTEPNITYFSSAPDSIHYLARYECIRTDNLVQIRGMLEPCYKTVYLL